MSFDHPTSLRLVRESLELLDRFGAEPVNVRDLKMSDRTLVVEVTVESPDPIKVRGEIAKVMGALSGLDVPGLFPVLGVQSFGVRAFEVDGSELLWILSSVAAARFAGSGQPLEWLSRSLVQDNTPAYRRAQADRHLSQAETTLRDLIARRGRELGGEAFLQLLWSSDTIDRLRRQAADEGDHPDDLRSLLDYAYLAELRDGILGRWDWFRDSLPEADAFRERMTSLNRIRRKVAHHRPISEDELRRCRAAAIEVLEPIGSADPDMAADFLVDRWEERTAEVMSEAQSGINAPSVPESGQVSEAERQRAAAAALRAQKDAIDGAVTAIEALVVPAVRRRQHQSLLNAMHRWSDALRALIDVAQRPNLTMDEALAAQQDYTAALDEVSKLREQLQALRLGLKE